MAAPHHRTREYQLEAAAVRAAANADPTTRCARCNGLARADDPWEAGHPDLPDGTPDYNAPLRAEHRSENRKAGLLYGQRRTRRRRTHTSRDW